MLLRLIVGRVVVGAAVEPICGSRDVERACCKIHSLIKQNVARSTTG